MVVDVPLSGMSVSVVVSRNSTSKTLDGLSDMNVRERPIPFAFLPSRYALRLTVDVVLIELSTHA